jgi:hypothetical protein
MCVAFMPVHLGASLVQKVSKTHLGAVLIFPRIFRIFPEFILIFPELFYLLEGSKIIFMSSKHFIWIAQVPMCLWEVFWNFWDFLAIFRSLKYFLDFFWNYLCTGIYFGKKPLPTGLGRARGPDPTRAGPAARPAKAHRPKPSHGAGRRHGVCAEGSARPRHYKRGESSTPRALPLHVAHPFLRRRATTGAPPLHQTEPPLALTSRLPAAPLFSARGEHVSELPTIFFNPRTRHPSS